MNLIISNIFQVLNVENLIQMMENHSQETK